jgi:hypothetical protein
MTAELERAFSRAGEFASIDWEIWFPDHCYICHIANTPTDGKVQHDQAFSSGAGVMTCVPNCRGCAYEDDTSACGPHCEGASPIPG